jgi:hypothetical protein
MSLTFEESLTFYQSAFRNVGLYTAISLGLLTMSRIYRANSNALYTNSFLILSIITILLAVTTLHNLINQLTIYSSKYEDDEKTLVDIWLSVAKGGRFLVYPIMGLTVFALYRETSRK